ncbi:MAG: fumarylacetoacetate hydrolase family protein [bacterium]
MEKVLKVFSFTNEKGHFQIGIKFEKAVYNFSRAWDLYKQIKNQGRGPGLDFLQVMVEADFFNQESFLEVMTTLRQFRPTQDLQIKSSYKIQPPIGRPQKILCVGRNYQKHAEELGNAVPEEPVFFSKSPSALIAHDEKIRIPRDVGRVDYEGELAVVIGKKAHHISEKYALEFVAGFSILVDVTARDLQQADIKAGKPWFRAKSFDTFCPFGPYLVPRDAIKDYHDLQLQLIVNGNVKQQARISEMIFDVPELVAYLSKHLTLQPGDVIATGTPAGVGALESGDVIECRISGLGTLKSAVE